MSWEGRYFGPEAALAAARAKARAYKHNGRNVAAAMEIASPYYSAAGRIWADIGNGKRSRLAYLRVAWYLWRAVQAANYIHVREMQLGISPAQWSTLVPILRTRFIGRLKEPGEVENLARRATTGYYFDRPLPQVAPGPCHPHDAALLWAEAMKAWIAKSEEKAVGARKKVVLLLAAYQDGQMEPGQVARLYRDIVAYDLDHGRHEIVEQDLPTIWLRIKAGGEDQVEKFKALLRRYGVPIPRDVLNSL